MLTCEQGVTTTTAINNGIHSAVTSDIGIHFNQNSISGENCMNSINLETVIT